MKVLFIVVLFCADVFRVETAALNESNATIAAATKVFRVDEWRFIDGSFLRSLILWVATIHELSMKFRERHRAARDLPMGSNVFRFYDLQLRKLIKELRLWFHSSAPGNVSPWVRIASRSGRSKISQPSRRRRRYIRRRLSVGGRSSYVN